MIKFNNGKFRVMQITDIQDTYLTSKDTLNFIGAALDKARPDLVVLTGDQVKSYGVSMAVGDMDKNIEKTIRNILKPIDERGIPFTFVYGNHDVPKNGEYSKQTEVYESFPTCVDDECTFRFNDTDTMCLPVYDSQGTSMKRLFYLIDNCHKLPGGGNGVTEEQIAWLEDRNNDFTQMNGGKPVPAIVFQHIPVFEMYYILKEVPKDTKGALEGNSANRGHYYVITDEMKTRNEYMGENVACPGARTGQFEKWVEMGNIQGAYFGHDHNNCFTGEYDGIKLGYTPGAGFNVYGPDLERAVRVFDFSEDSDDYITYVLTYREVCGTKVKNKAKLIMYNKAPSSVDAAKPMIIKGVSALSGITGFAVTMKLLKNRRK